MKPLREFHHRSIKYLFADIDGTMTSEGKIAAETYHAIWSLAKCQIHLIPVTGRPAGWCDLMVRHWPIHGVIGENGALAYRLDGRRMKRHEALPTSERKTGRQRLKALAKEVLAKFPGTKIAADQFCRRFDVAVDFAEDVPALSVETAQQIQSFFAAHGAHAKVSNIHVNAWFGDFDKSTMVDWYARNWIGLSNDDLISRAAFVGDSMNDEPMFKKFHHSFAVANVKPFLSAMKFKPKFVTAESEGAGFAELTAHLIQMSK